MKSNRPHQFCFIFLLGQVKLAHAEVVVFCPDSSNDRHCIWDSDDQVICGPKCRYINQCYATAASSDFTSETCYKVCPDSSNDNACSIDVFDPVECGVQCKYQNQCFATAAGFTAKTCFNSCPNNFIARYSCEGVYDPVKCGECKYQNQCTATSAFSGFTAETCEKVSCPESDYQHDDCGEVYDPVKCGECEFQNQCSATEASSYFSADTCKKILCPKSSNDVVCSAEYDPVKCGEDLECEYDNQCLATAASSDFTAETCKKILCPESSTDIACTKAYNPVKCGEDLECEYDNQCLATAASSDFTAETCKKSCKTTDNNIFIHEPCEGLCEDSKSYMFKLDNEKERKCSYITKRDTETRRDMYCKGETVRECCKACKRKYCYDKSDFKFKRQNEKTVDCSWLKKGNRGKRRSKYCKGKVKRKCCESCTYVKDYVSDTK